MLIVIIVFGVIVHQKEMFTDQKKTEIGEKDSFHDCV